MFAVPPQSGNVQTMATRALDLLGGPNGSASLPVMKSSKDPELTIFYGGTVNVYNDVPADKAHAIMLLLSTNGARQSHRESINTAPNSAAVGAHTSECYASSLPPVGKSIVYKHGLSRPSTPSPSSPLQVLQSERKPTPPINKRTQAELPFARKASLARFLEKRKDRVQASSAPEADNENAGDAIKKIKTSE